MFDINYIASNNTLLHWIAPPNIYGDGEGTVISQDVKQGGQGVALLNETTKLPTLGFNKATDSSKVAKGVVRLRRRPLCPIDCFTVTILCAVRHGIHRC